MRLEWLPLRHARLSEQHGIAAVRHGYDSAFDGMHLPADFRENLREPDLPAQEPPKGEPAVKTKPPNPKYSPMSPYDRDFCEALPYGYTGAMIYAGIRRNIREDRAKKKAAAARRAIREARAKKANKAKRRAV